MRVFGRDGVARKQQYEHIVVWLKAHRPLWSGVNALPAIEVARALRDVGFYSSKTSLCDIDVERLIQMAKR